MQRVVQSASKPTLSTSNVPSASASTTGTGTGAGTCKTGCDTQAKGGAEVQLPPIGASTTTTSKDCNPGMFCRFKSKTAERPKLVAFISSLPLLFLAYHMYQKHELPPPPTFAFGEVANNVQNLIRTENGWNMNANSCPKGFMGPSCNLCNPYHCGDGCSMNAMNCQCDCTQKYQEMDMGMGMDNDDRINLFEQDNNNNYDENDERFIYPALQGNEDHVPRFGPQGSQSGFIYIFGLIVIVIVVILILSCLFRC